MAAQALTWLEQANQHLLMWDDPLYPALLAELNDAPPLLFVAGDPQLFALAVLDVQAVPRLTHIAERRARRDLARPPTRRP